jgi:hypothetical protein
VATAARRIDAQRLLLCEGREDQLFVEALLRDRAIGGVQVLPIGGKQQLRPNLAVVIRTPGFERVRWLGVMQDADDNPQSALQRIRGALQSAELPMPVRAWETRRSEPAVAALILPDADSPGDLETLVRRALGQTPGADCANEFVQCVTARFGAPPQPESKAWIHAFLSSLNPPTLRLGEAAQAGLLPLTSGVFDRLTDLVAAG